MQRADSLAKTLMLGKIEGRRRGRKRMRWLDDMTDSKDMSLSRDMVRDRETWRAAVYVWDRKEQNMKERLNNNKDSNGDVK